ncbi:MAG: tryptophan--tRNA ligase [Alphaproteobacteria bacterium]|nr:tryptophan--tRNA ligase [Alphaproteobacteria bacterium]
MGRIFSGIQPTGDLHIGNYLGAIRNWVKLQDAHENLLFCMVDLHALTTLPNPQNMTVWTREVAAAYIASGINPEKSMIFPQSAVAAHSELAWILSCLTPLGWLNRMTQFKEKAGKHKEQANLGLYSYPVLMAADILIYKTTHVPVGEDQKQHLELARDLAGAFNRQYGKDYFELPEPFILKTAARVMSLRDGTAKMSKSDPSDYSRIHFMDDPDTIVLKIRKAKTDSDPIAGAPEAMENRPEALNLLGIYAALSDTTMEESCRTFEGAHFSTFKKTLADQIIAAMDPIRQEMLALLKDPASLDRILKKGGEEANELASQNLKEIKEIVGFLRV